jgi:hypothetical protein
MSAIDMVNTYRGWIKCLEMACPALSEKIKNRVKQLYKDLRLDDKYWRRAMEADIYTCCLAVDLAGMTPRESVLRQLYSESIWDVLMSLFKKSKNKDDDTSVEEEEAERYETDRPITAADMMPNADNQEPSAISQSITFTYAPETENSVSVGIKPISSADENVLMTVGDSMVAGSKDDSYYVEKFYQLIRFSNDYATTRNFVTHMSANLDAIEKPGSDFGSNTVVARSDSDSGRSPDLSVTEDSDLVRPTYVIPDDFNKERSEKLSSYRFTVRMDNEPLDAYYARMYKAAMA